MVVVHNIIQNKWSLFKCNWICLLKRLFRQTIIDSNTLYIEIEIFLDYWSIIEYYLYWATWEYGGKILLQCFSVLYRERTSNLFRGDEEIYKQQVDKMGYKFILKVSLLLSRSVWVIFRRYRKHVRISFIEIRNLDTCFNLIDFVIPNTLFTFDA